MNATTEYKKAGVDVPLSDAFSAHFGGLCRTTYRNSSLARVVDMSRGHFRGPRGLSFSSRLPEGYIIVAAPDGVGTKVIINTAANMQHMSGRDLAEMTIGDITRHGGCAIAMTNVLDTAVIGESEDDPVYQAHLRMAQGLVDAANESKVILLNGETAVLGVCVGSQIKDALTKYNWAGVAIGINHPDMAILGDKIRPGNAVIAFKEKGFRSNGLSLVRQILATRFGEEWWNVPEAWAHIQAAAEPSVLTGNILTELNGWYNSGFHPIVRLTGIASLSGGGIKSKFGDDLIFRQGFSAKLNNLPEPPDIMRRCAEWGNVSDEECYTSWHGGPGVLVVCDESDASRVIDFAGFRGIDAQHCGVITEPGHEGPMIEIESKFRPGKVRFYPKEKAA